MSLKFVFVLYLLDLAHACCPNGWVVHDGSCYLFSQQNASFLDAEQICSGFQGHLVNIGDSSENTFVQSFAQALKDTDYYIGLADLITEGEWQWYDTDSVAQLTDWAPKEPGYAITRNCVVMSSINNYKWSDVQCSSPYRYICELAQSLDFEIVG